MSVLVYGVHAAREMTMGRWSIALSVAVLVAALVPTARAEKAGIRPEFQVSVSGSYTYYGSVYPDAHNEGKESVAIAASDAGTFVVVWEDLYTYRGGPYSYETNPGVWFRRLDDLGRPMGPEFRVSGFTSYAKGGAAVASDPAGRFVVVWDDHNASAQGDDDGTGILARRYNASGGALGLPFLVNTFTTGSQSTPKVAMEGGGGFVVVWAHRPALGTYILAGRKYDSTGAASGGEFQVNSDTSCCPAYDANSEDESYRHMGIAADSAGNFMVVWGGQGDDGNDVMARVFDSTGAAVGPQFLVNSYTTGYQLAPSVAADNQGHFVVAWVNDPSYEVLARRYHSTGAPLGDEFQVTDTGPGYNSYGPKIAADADGDFVIVWDDGYYYGIFGREFDSTGAPAGAPFRVDDTFEDYDEFFVQFSGVASSAAGEFVVVWSQYDSYFDQAFEVEGRRLGEAPVPCTPAPKTTGCREPTIAHRGVFRFKNNGSPAQRNLVWRWVRGQATSEEALGDPFTTDSYALCVYDASARPQPLISTAVPAGGACGNAPCWKVLSGNRIDYLDGVRYVDGMELIRMKPGDEGKASALVRARKEDLELPSTPLIPPVTVQLQVANGECWTAEYGEFIKKNEGGVFKANPGGIIPTTTTTTTSASTTTTTASTTTTTTVPACGNSFLEGTEECDDGNTGEGDGCSSVCTCNPATTPAACDLSGAWHADLGGGISGPATFVEDGAGNWMVSGTLAGSIPFEAAGTRSNSCAVGILEMPFLPPEGAPIRMYVNDACDGAFMPSEGGPTLAFTRLP